MESDSSCTIDLGIEDPRWSERLENIEAFCRRCVTGALAEALPDRRGEVEISVTLASDARIRELNARYRGRDRPTNVLSFPALTAAELGPALAAPIPVLLGDILLAFETVREEAARQGKTLEAHLGHLLVHGVLHLLGHDHQREREALVMEALERRILARLGLPDPYAVPAP